MTEPLKRADPELVKALARDAGDLLENRAFTAAVRTLHMQLLGELILEGNDAKREQDALAQLRLLEKLTKRLASMMHDQKFAQGAAVRTGHNA
jgi:hypothetical protein